MAPRPSPPAPSTHRTPPPPAAVVPAGVLPGGHAHTARRAATVDALLDAGVAELGDIGYDTLTLRSVATRAGVTHTTAYEYFSTKAALVAEVFVRRLGDLPPPPIDPHQPVAERVTAALSGPSLLLADDPALASAALAALLDGDPEVVRLRTRVGALLTARLEEALGPDGDPAVVEAMLLAFSGAMLQAGMGYFDYDGVVRRMARLAHRIGDCPPPG